MWQIKYQNEFLDIAPNQEPDIERNSPLFLIDNILQEVSSPFIIAYSDKNTRLIGHYFFELTKKTLKKLDVELYVEGSFFANATMVVEGSGINAKKTGESSVSGYLQFGISNFFSKIKDKLLTQLSLGGDRVFSHTTNNPLDGSGGFWQHFQATFDGTYDYVMLPYKNLAFVDTNDVEFTGIDGWGNKFDGSKISTGQPVVPWAKIAYVLNQIFEENGWHLDTSEMTDTEWQKLLLYSNYTISTQVFTLSGGSVLTSDKGSVIIQLAKAMPPNVTCSSFLFEICKRYMWTLSFDTANNTCRLIALKDIKNKPKKDWTLFATSVIDSQYQTEQKIFAYKNDFNGEDSYPSAPDFSQYPFIGYTVSKETLPSPTTLNDNSIIYAWLENKWYITRFDGTSATWEEFADNIYDQDAQDPTDTFETQVTTLPIRKAQMDNGLWGFFPIVNQTKGTSFGIRTIIYHGMVKQVLDDNTPVSSTYPYGSSTNTSPGYDSQLTWSNVYKHYNYVKDYGMIAYWYDAWTKMISLTEEITRRINLPLHELVNFKWDTIILIHNIPYLIKSYIQPLNYTGYIEAKLQRVNLVADPEDAVIVEPTDAHFTNQVILSADRYNYNTQQHVKGEAGATLTIEVILLTKSNPAFYFKVNDTELFLGNTYTVTLDGSGNGDYNVKLGGVTIDGQAVLAKVQIISTTIGSIGTPDTAQYSKITG